jgi:hypothetical protein
MYVARYRHCHDGHSYEARLDGMTILTVTSLCAGQIPSVALEKFDHVQEFHRTGTS